MGANSDCPSCRGLATFNTTDLVESEFAHTCSSCGHSFASLEVDAFGEQPSTGFVGRFELLSLIGHGSFGRVWKAHDPHLDRHVAIKIPRREELDPVEAELFLREARTAAQIQHPNVVGIHEVDRDGDQIYLVCDLIEGESLSARCGRSPLTISEAVSITRTMAVALSHVHESGVIHRDLKPSNILLDVDGKPYLSDFGLARRTHGDITLTVEGQLVGTPAYMSPEQAKGEANRVDERSDVYCLGVVLYKLVTGQLPFDGPPHAIISQVANDPPPRPRSINPNVPCDLEIICLKCLEKRPERRFLTAAELAVDLDRIERGEPILSRRVSMLERSWRWSRRYPWVPTLVVLLLCFIAGGASVIQANKEASADVVRRKQAEGWAMTAELWATEFLGAIIKGHGDSQNVMTEQNQRGTATRDFHPSDFPGQSPVVIRDPLEMRRAPSE